MGLGADQGWLLVCADVRPSGLLPRLGRRAERLRVLEIGPAADDGMRAARGLGWRRPRGVLLALPAETLAGPDTPGHLPGHLPGRLAPVLDRLRERHGRLPAILLLTHDALPGDAEPLGGFGGTPDGVFQEALRQAACRSLASLAAADGAVAPALPGRLAAETPRLAAGADAVLDRSGLDFAGAFLVPAATARREAGLLPAALAHAAVGKAPGRRRIAYPAAAALLAATAAAGLFSWSQLKSLEGRLATLGAELAPAAAPDAAPSPVALAALGEMASLAESGGLRLPLLPASWSGTAEEAMRRQVEEKVADILVAPVRRRMDGELKEIEAGLAAISSFPSRAGTMPQLAALLDRLLDLAGQERRFRLQAGGDIREQWETLAAGPEGGPPPLGWLDTQAGRAGLGRALAAAPGTGGRPEELAVLAVGMIGADLRETLRAENAVSAIARARDEAANAIGTLSRAEGADAGLDRTAAGLARALSLIARQAKDLSAGAASAEAAYDALEGRLRQALDEAGLVPAHVWGEIRHDMRRAARERDAALAETTLPPFGPLFQASATPVPALSRAAGALETLVPLIETRPVPRADFAALAAGTGAPDPALLSQAADRFARRQAWMRDHAGALPAALAGRLLPVLDRRSAEAGLAALAAAYRPGGGTASGMPDPDGLARSAAALDDALAGLAAAAPDMLGDAAWLAGVRAYRLLEALDHRYEQRNAFRFETAIRAWDGEGRVLRGTAFRDAAALDALMDEGTRRLRTAAAIAAPLLRTLGNDAVRAALPQPALTGKWRALVQAAGPGGAKESEGLDALRHYVSGTLGTFGRGDCGNPDRLPAAAGPAEDPFAAELDAIRQALEESCGTLLSAGMPLPARKPDPDGPREPAAFSW